MGLHNWQWLFIIEALPAIVLGVFVLFYLDDRPVDAKWLADGEKRWLEQQLALEEKVNAETGGSVRSRTVPPWRSRFASSSTSRAASAW